MQIWGDIVKEILWVIIVVLIALVSYPLHLFIKMKKNKKRIMKVLNEIYLQVDLKHNLLKQYLEINKDVIEEEKFLEMESILTSYDEKKAKNVKYLKKCNEIYSEYMFSFDDSLMKKTCKESNEQIKSIKDYYNVLVIDYNSYKSNKINSILSKAMFINDESMF